MRWLIQFKSGKGCPDELGALLADRPGGVNLYSADGSTALHIALQEHSDWDESDQTRIVLCLLNHGGNLYAANDAGQSPLGSLVPSPHKEFIIGLLHSYRQQQCDIPTVAPFNAKELHAKSFICTTPSSVNDNVVYGVRDGYEIIAWDSVEDCVLSVHCTDDSIYGLRAELAKLSKHIEEYSKAETASLSVLNNLQEQENELKERLTTLMGKETIAGFAVFSAPCRRSHPIAAGTVRSEFLWLANGVVVEIFLSQLNVVRDMSMSQHNCASTKVRTRDAYPFCCGPNGTPGCFVDTLGSSVCLTQNIPNEGQPDTLRLAVLKVHLFPEGYELGDTKLALLHKERSFDSVHDLKASRQDVPALTITGEPAPRYDLTFVSTHKCGRSFYVFVTQEQPIVFFEGAFSECGVDVAASGPITSASAVDTQPVRVFKNGCERPVFTLVSRVVKSVRIVPKSPTPEDPRNVQLTLLFLIPRDKGPQHTYRTLAHPSADILAMIRVGKEHEVSKVNYIDSKLSVLSTLRRFTSDWEEPLNAPDQPQNTDENHESEAIVEAEQQLLPLLCDWMGAAKPRTTTPTPNQPTEANPTESPRRTTRGRIHSAPKAAPPIDLQQAFFFSRSGENFFRCNKHGRLHAFKWHDVGLEKDAPITPRTPEGPQREVRSESLLAASLEQDAQRHKVVEKPGGSISSMVNNAATRNSISTASGQSMESHPDLRSDSHRVSHVSAGSRGRLSFLECIANPYVNVCYSRLPKQEGDEPLEDFECIMPTAKGPIDDDNEEYAAMQRALEEKRKNAVVPSFSALVLIGWAGNQPTPDEIQCLQIFRQILSREEGQLILTAKEAATVPKRDLRLIKAAARFAMPLAALNCCVSCLLKFHELELDFSNIRFAMQYAVQKGSMFMPPSLMVGASFLQKADPGCISLSDQEVRTLSPFAIQHSSFAAKVHMIKCSSEASSGALTGAGDFVWPLVARNESLTAADVANKGSALRSLKEVNPQRTKGVPIMYKCVPEYPDTKLAPIYVPKKQRLFWD